MTNNAITVARLDVAIATTAACMKYHPDLAPQLMLTLKRLEEERDSIVANGDPLDYAARLVARISAPRLDAV
jgi:hypothetical protein